MKPRKIYFLSCCESDKFTPNTATQNLIGPLIATIEEIEQQQDILKAYSEKDIQVLAYTHWTQDKNKKELKSPKLYSQIIGEINVPAEIYEQIYAIIKKA